MNDQSVGEMAARRGFRLETRRNDDGKELYLLIDNRTDTPMRIANEPAWMYRDQVFAELRMYPTE
jgi:hypothetical protein